MSWLPRDNQEVVVAFIGAASLVAAAAPSASLWLHLVGGAIVAGLLVLARRGRR